MSGLPEVFEAMLLLELLVPVVALELVPLFEVSVEAVEELGLVDLEDGLVAEDELGDVELEDELGDVLLAVDDELRPADEDELGLVDVEEEELGLVEVEELGLVDEVVVSFAARVELRVLSVVLVAEELGLMADVP